MESIIRVCGMCEHEFFWKPHDEKPAIVECPRCWTLMPWDLYDPPHNHVTQAEITRHQRGQVLKAREFFDAQRRRRKAG